MKEGETKVINLSAKDGYGERRQDLIVTKRREEIPHPRKWEGVEAVSHPFHGGYVFRVWHWLTKMFVTIQGSKMRTSKGKRTFVILEITVRVRPPTGMMLLPSLRERLQSPTRQ